jgi:hypothetical protein
LLVAIPKRVINPIMAGILTMPVVNQRLNTPPISARGRDSRIIRESLTFLNSWKRRRKLPE